MWWTALFNVLKTLTVFLYHVNLNVVTIVSSGAQGLCLHSHFNQLQLCSVTNQRLTSIIPKKASDPPSQLFKIPLKDGKPLVYTIITWAISPEKTSHQLWCCWELLSALAVPLLLTSFLSFSKTSVYQNVISYRKIKSRMFQNRSSNSVARVKEKNMYGDLL